MADEARLSPERVKRYLNDMDYPADREDLMEHAQFVGAPADIQRNLRGMPSRMYSDVDDVAKALAEQ